MKFPRLAIVMLALCIFAPWHPAKAADVICYNCPPEWADWASMLKSIKADLITKFRMTTRTRDRHSLRFWPREQSAGRYQLFWRDLRHEGQDAGCAPARYTNVIRNP